MSLELLDKPEIQVRNGVTYNILAVDRPPMPDEHGVEQPQPQARALGYVAVTPITIGRYMEPGDPPYMYHEAVNVRGIIEGGSPIYDKEVSPRGLLGVPLPFYGARIALAKMRAGHRVKSLLS